MKPLHFVANYEISLRAGDEVIDQFEETIKVVAMNTEEAYSMAKNMLYDKLVNRKVEVPYENYMVNLKDFREDPETEAKYSFLKLSVMFYLSSGMEFIFTMLCLRHILLVVLISILALHFDKEYLYYVAYGVNVFSGLVIITKYRDVVSKLSYIWLNNVVLFSCLVQGIIFWL